MADLIEIALDYLTDNKLFEKLASEIMRDEGYPNITPLGGIKDEGMDAVQDKFFLHEGRSRIVFQYTIQEYLTNKIDETIEKLARYNIQYHELIIVTKRSISPERQKSLIETARKKRDVSLRIYERKTIANRLSNTENGIFGRLFPDIDKQVADLKTSQPPLLSGKKSSLFEISMLKSSIAFTFNKAAPRARRSIFDYLTLGLLLERAPEYLSIAKLSERYGTTIGKIRPTDDQIRASLERLGGFGFIEWKGDLVRPSRKALETIEGSTAEANDATNSLISDIVDEVGRISKEKISEEDRLKIERNIQDLLIMLFRLSGIEIANQVIKDRVPGPVYHDSLSVFVEKAKKQLPNYLGELLISVVSQRLATPSPEQARTLTNWSLAYIGVSVMNLDPTLKEFQATRIAKKAFVLDTDFILDCLVQECPRSNIYLELIKSCLNVGSKVIIPESCLAECVKHAELSPRTYNHFGPKLLSLSAEVVRERVWNVFVKGYYFGVISGRIPPSMQFEKYLENYYLPSNPIGFMKDVIRAFFPAGTDILNPSSLLSKEIPEEQLAKLCEELSKILSQSKKAEYRTPEMINELAEIDARLFLSTFYLNEEEAKPSPGVLGGNFYLVTSSGRYLRATRNIGIRDAVTTRPQSLAALLELVGNMNLTDPEFVSLFENPLLKYAVEQSMADVEVLIDSGIGLRGVSLPKLRYDLDQELHERITAFCESESQAEQATAVPESNASDPAFIGLLKSAGARGYARIPEVDMFMEILEKTQEDAAGKAKALDDLEGRFKELEKAITYFGKRKQRYLKQIAHRQATKKE